MHEQRQFCKLVELAESATAGPKGWDFVDSSACRIVCCYVSCSGVPQGRCCVAWRDYCETLQQHISIGSTDVQHCAAQQFCSTSCYRVVV